jgi:hypothetical protein
LLPTEVIESYAKRRKTLLEGFDGLRAQIESWLLAYPDGATITQVSHLAGLLEVRRETLRRLMENDEALMDHYLTHLKHPPD